MADSSSSNLAIFIDFENFKRPNAFDAKKLLNYLGKRGRVTVARAYADWSVRADSRELFLSAGFELIEVTSLRHRGKNAADIQLSIDAMEVAILHSQIEQFVIVSGDSDFSPLMNKLRKYQKRVIVIAQLQWASRLIDGACDELIDYLEVDPEFAKSGRSQQTQQPRRKVPTANDLPCSKTDYLTAVDTVLEILLRLTRSKDEVCMSELAAELERQSQLKVKSLGFSQLLKFLQAAESDGFVRLNRQHSVYRLRVPDRTTAAMKLIHRLRSEGQRKSAFRSLRILLNLRGLDLPSCGLAYKVVWNIHAYMKSQAEFVTANRIVMRVGSQAFSSGDFRRGRTSIVQTILKVWEAAGAVEDSGTNVRTPLYRLVDSASEFASCCELYKEYLIDLTDQNSVQFETDEWSEVLEQLRPPSDDRADAELSVPELSVSRQANRVNEIADRSEPASVDDSSKPTASVVKEEVARVETETSKQLRLFSS